MAADKKMCDTFISFLECILFFIRVYLIFFEFYRLRSVGGGVFFDFTLSPEFTECCAKMVEVMQFCQLQTDVKYMLENIVLMNFFGKMFGGNGGKV